MVRATQIRDIDAEAIDDEYVASQPQALPAPLERDGKFDCPRCEARLLFDGEKLGCLMCGYEHIAPRTRMAQRSPAEMLDALPLFRTELSAYIESLGASPQDDSRGAADCCDVSASDLAALQFGRLYSQQALVAMGQSLVALARGLEPPTPEYGTWSIARTVLDSASLVCWLLDGRIEASERAARALAVQANDLEAEQRFLASLVGCRAGERTAFAEALETNRARRQEVASAVAARGTLPRIPDAAERAELMGARFEYLMCSSIVDGRPWALLHTTALQSGFDTDRASSILVTQLQLSADWFARSSWAYVSWMSPGSLDELRASLEFGYDSLVLPDTDGARFWRERPRSARRRVAA